MDHWSNLNLNQAYGRLPTPSNAPSLNRFDLHLLEQQGFATAGLQAAAGLSSPLPAHATLSPAARTFTAGLPHVNYSALPMAPLFDSMAQLTQGFAAASQAPYRAAMQGVAAQPAVYAIDPSGHLPVSSAARFAASIVAASAGTESQQKTISLFNTDPHAMSDPIASAVGGIASQSASTMSQAVYGRTSGHIAPSNPYSGLPTNYTAGALSSDRYTGKTGGSVTAGEPPPAHSGSRPNTTARTPSYQTKEFAQPTVTAQRPQPAAVTTQAREIPPARSVYTPVDQRSSDANPPTAHSNLQRPGDDLMQKLIQSYGQRQQISNSSTSAGRPAVTTYASSPPVQPVAALANVGRAAQPQASYVDQNRGGNHRPGTSTAAYQGYNIGSPLQYGQAQYASAPDEMEEISYDDVSSPEGMGLQEAAATLAGTYLNLGNKPGGVGIVQSCSAQAVQRQAPIVLGRVGGVQDPTIQAQADSTTKPKKGSSASRNARATPAGETGGERGGKRSRSGSSRSRAKGKAEEEVAVPTIQHCATEMSVPNLAPYGTQTAYAQLLPTDFGTGQSYVQADAFAQYRVATDPYQAATECMIAAARPEMAHRLTAVAAPTDQSNVQQEAQVFMTNMFGSAFVNPNELLTVEQITFVDPNEAASTYSSQVTPAPKPDPKHRPIIEEEFGHLAADPTGGTSASASLPTTADTKVTPIQTSVQQQSAAASENSVASVASGDGGETEGPKGPKASAFMNSFMSFLQGKKPETLASVSTSVVTKKPVLPKYIPEPPRPKPPPPPPTPTTPVASSSGVRTGTASGVKSGEKMKDKIIAQFSDDEDEPLAKRLSTHLASSINKALLSLNSGSKSTAPIRGQSSPGKRGRPPGKKVSPGGSSAVTFKGANSSFARLPPKKATSQAAKHRKGEKWVEGGENSDDDVVLLDSPLPTREKTSRKAKEAAVQRGRSSIQKGKRGVAIIFDSDDEMDDVEPDSDDARSTHEHGYDSDKDPAWKPQSQSHAHHAIQMPPKKISVTLSSGSDDEDVTTRIVRGTGRGRPRGRGRGRGSTTMMSSSNIGHQTQSVVASEPAPVDTQCQAEYNEKSCNSEDVEPEDEGVKPVPNEAVNQSQEDQCQLSQPTETVVEPATEQSVNESETEAVNESFSVYVQILVSQALEPTFLAALLDQPDAYYIDPLQKIDSLLAKRKSSILSMYQWNPEFLTCMEKMSMFSFVDCDEVCYSEATDNQVEPAAKRVRFHGYMYGSDNLDIISQLDDVSAKLFAVTSSESQVVPLLHGLVHFKFNLLQDCRVQVAALKTTAVDTPDDQVLDQCLRDQVWMQRMFDRLTALLY